MSYRVRLSPPVEADRKEFLELMRASRAFHRPWAAVPTDDARFDAYLADAHKPDYEPLLVRRLEDEAIIGFFNISQITHGPLQSAYLGYAVGGRFAGQGYMREGIELALRHAFVVLGLHRLEANIQPGNEASLALARAAGFRREGYSPRYLKISGRWRDHERWALLAEEWHARSGERGADGRARDARLDAGRPT